MAKASGRIRRISGAAYWTLFTLIFFDTFYQDIFGVGAHGYWGPIRQFLPYFGKAQNNFEAGGGCLYVLWFLLGVQYLWLIIFRPRQQWRKASPWQAVRTACFLGLFAVSAWGVYFYAVFVG